MTVRGRFDVLAVDSMALVQGPMLTLEALRASLSLRSTREGGPTLHLYERTARQDRLRIPRALAQGLTDKRPEVHRPFDRPVRCLFELRPDQRPLVERFLERLDVDSPFGGILRSPTGSGKTIMALAILRALGHKTLVIVPTDRLMTQWQEKFLEHTDLRADDIGIIKQNKCQVAGRQVCIGMIHSLCRDKYPEWVKSSFGTVIFDEVHTVAAETFSRTAPMFNCNVRMGLSATPRRKDGMANVFRWHIGEIIASYDRFQVRPKVILVPYRGTDASQNGMVWRGELQLGRYWNRLAQSGPRNKFVAERVRRLYARGLDTLVLSDRLRLLYVVKAELKGSVPRHDMGLFTGSAKQLDRKVILGTYGSAGMGADIPRLQALVLATPRADVEQAVGRLLRGTGTPEVVDIVDEASPIMQGWARKRFRFYRSVARDIENYTRLNL